MLVDSHCHLDRLDYEKKHTNIAEVIEKAKAKGVSHLLSVCVTLDDYPAMAEMIAPYENVSSTCGVHPLYKEAVMDQDLLFQYASSDKVVAIVKKKVQNKLVVYCTALLSQLKWQRRQ